MNQCRKRFLHAYRKTDAKCEVKSIAEMEVVAFANLRGGARLQASSY